MKPVVDGLQKAYKDKVEFRLYNVETDQEGVALANSMGVTAVPTFVYVNTDGTTASTKVGPITAEEAGSQLDKLQ